MKLHRVLLLWGLVILAGDLLPAQERVRFSRQSEIIYGRKHGLAMTLDVFAPAGKPNGLGVIAVVSGGWFSSRGSLVAPAGQLPAVFNQQLEELLRRGYTVFTVVHGSQPKYTIPEIQNDLHRAVRYIRHQAASYHVDPARLGIFGGSAGGHLSLMQGTAGQPGDPQAVDPVDRQSSRVQVVVAYFPPTDFLNYGADGVHFDKVVRSLLGGRNPFLAALDFREYDQEKELFERITNVQQRRERITAVSPIHHVTKDDPPTLIIHGDADQLVPIQQAKRILARFQEAGVTASLKVMPGKAHGWTPEAEEVGQFVDWFDTHLSQP